MHDKSFENAKPVEESKGIDEDLLNSVLQRLEKAEVHIPSLIPVRKKQRKYKTKWKQSSEQQRKIQRKPQSSMI